MQRVLVYNVRRLADPRFADSQDEMGYVPQVGYVCTERSVLLVSTQFVIALWANCTAGSALRSPKQPPTMTRGAQRDKDRARADARAGKNASGSSGGGGLKQAAKGASDAAALAAKKEMKAKLKAEGKIKEKTGGTKAPPKSKVKNAVRLGQAEGKRIRLGLCPCVCVCDVR